MSVPCLLRIPLLMVLSFLSIARCMGEDQPIHLTIKWDKTVSISQTAASLQVVVNPQLQRGTPVHDNAFKALRDLRADHVRYVPWVPYPKLCVAELEPPANGKTSWDFSLIDPITIDFLEATKGHPVTINFSTIPQWMFKSDKGNHYPDNPTQVMWDYEQGSEFRDPSYKEAADYYARLISWYTQGGFTDELGKRHESGYHYKISHWEVLNEPELERNIPPEAYAKFYDAVVTEMRKAAPDMKFVAMGSAAALWTPSSFEYFLDPKNHKPGVPIDYISYHFYAIPTADQTPEVQQFTFFAQAMHF